MPTERNVKKLAGFDKELHTALPAQEVREDIREGYPFRSALLSRGGEIYGARRAVASVRLDSQGDRQNAAAHGLLLFRR